MHKKIIYLCFIIFWWLPVCAAQAWSSVGHMIVGRIAYEHLSPEARHQINPLIHAMDSIYPPVGFVKATVWADWIKKTVSAFNEWHYMAKPYVVDDATGQKEEQQNVVWAIEQSLKVLKNPRATTFEKAFFLRFLIHLVGDVHQPIHCITQYSHAHPEGDAGGNLYAIKTVQANNLHQFWDGGVNLFFKERDASSTRSSSNFSKKSFYVPLKPGEISTLSDKIEQDYPAAYFGDQINKLTPAVWCEESYDIAKNMAYRTPEGAEVTAEYIKQGQAIVEQRLALAGYRLAYLLNNLFRSRM